MRMVLLSLVLACAAAAQAEEFLIAVAPGVYVHRGQHADIDSPARGDSANLGVVVGARCVAVIDSGGAIATGAALRAKIRAITAEPVCYVINSHVHFDHVLGNAAFLDLEPTFVGHANLPDDLAASREFFLQNFAAELAPTPDAAHIVPPTLLVSDTLELDLGGRRLRVSAVAKAHSSTDLTVLDETSDTLFAGDLVFRERLPILDGSLKGWLTWLDTATRTSHARVVPGHGPVDTAWPAGAAPERAYFDGLLREVRAAIAAGVTLEDAQDRVLRGALGDWQLTARAHRLNVSRAYRELEWE